jgi:cytochrome c oxidase subunit 2
MLRRMLCWAPAAALAFLFVAASTAWAGMGQPSPGEMGLQGAASPVAVEIHKFYDLVNTIIVAIAVFVLLLLIYVMYRFNERANPTPSKATHNTLLEVAWTVVPILILVAIAIPSFRLLHLQYSYPKADVTLKATGYQWYWVHSYPELGFSFETRILDDASRQKLIAQHIPAPRNLAVDNEVIVPVNKVVNVLVTAAPDGVIHVVSQETFDAWADAMKSAAAAEKEAKTEKDKTKRREKLLLRRKLLKKAKDIVRQVAIEQGGRHFAEAKTQ